MKATVFIPAILVLTVLTTTRPFGAAEAGPWTDPAGDVPLPNADIVSGSATVSAGMVDLRVQFAAPPFPTTATHHITWCFDTDQDGTTGSACGSGDLLGADRGFTLFGGFGALSTCVFGFSQGMPGLDASSHLWFDPATNTLRMLFPLSLLSDDGVFDYAVESAFGGSSGANERAPNLVGFGSPGGFFTSDAGDLPPFDGTLLCPNRPPLCSAATADPAELSPPNHSLVPIEIVGVTDPDGDPVTIEVTGVTQDEPLDGQGDGNTCPDAVIEAGRASVRVERSGHGNGRVYAVTFVADDGHGGTCQGTVTVCVPHNQGQQSCVDDGQVVNSLGSCDSVGVKLLAPSLAEVVAPGQLYVVRYQQPPGPHAERVALLYSRDLGTNWTLQVQNQPNTGQIVWPVPSLPGENVLVTVADVSVSPSGIYKVLRVLGESDYFSIATSLAVDDLPAALTSAPIQPNPTAGNVLLNFALPHATEVAFDVFDVGGRRVKALLSGIREAGWHHLSWEGDTDAGGKAGPGLYFMRLRAGQEELTRRLVRSR